tara:strand:- start:11634 stop:13877 length:2244 start_codon:yes stop_codon:yes gene_type:complete
MENSLRSPAVPLLLHAGVTVYLVASVYTIVVDNMQDLNSTFKPITHDIVIRSIIREQLYLSDAQNNDLLTEGIAADLAQDAIQFAIGAAAEYAIGGAIAVGTFGAGTAVGPAVETAVDAAFAAKEVAGTIEAVASAAKNAGEFAGMLNKAIDGFGGDFGGYYDKLTEAVQITVGKMSEDGKSKITEIVEKLKQVVEDIVSEIIGAIESGIKLIIPDATAGLAAAKAIGVALKSLSEGAYDTLTGAIESVDFLNSAVTNPDQVVEYFEDILTQIAEKLKDVGEYFNEMSWPKAMLVVGPAAGAMLKKLGPKGMDELSKMLKGSIPDIVKVIDAVLTKVIPALFACLGIYQILMKDEYMTEEMKSEKEEGGPKALDIETDKPKPLTGESKKYLHNLINETIEENLSLISSQPETRQNIYEEEYVRKVLGIDLPLNESYPYSSAIQERILEEQLQLEGFFKDFKKLGGDTKNSALALRYIMEDPARISSYVDIIKADLKESYESLKDFLASVVSSLKEVIGAGLGDIDNLTKNIQTVIDWASGLLEKIKNLVGKAMSTVGWKGAMIISGALVGIGYVWSKLKGPSSSIIDGLGKVTGMLKSKLESISMSGASLVELMYTSDLSNLLQEQSLGEKVKAKLGEALKELTSTIKEIGPKVVAGLAVNALASALTGGVATAFKALQSVFGGAKVVFKFLGGPLEKFVSKIKNPKEETREAEAGEDDPTDSTKNESVILTRDQIRSIIGRSLNTI